MKNIFKNKSILIAGGTGMVGLPLTEKLNRTPHPAGMKAPENEDPNTYASSSLIYKSNPAASASPPLTPVSTVSSKLNAMDRVENRKSRLTTRS